MPAFKTKICPYVFLLAFCFVSCSETPRESEEYTYLLPDAEPDTNTYDQVPPLESMENIRLRLSLEKIYNSDQQLRFKHIELEKKYGIQSDTARSLLKQFFEIDSINLIKVDSILSKYGWIDRYDIGDQGSTTLWIVIQHSDLKTQLKYLPMIRRAVKEKRARPEELALLEDRVLVGQDKKQIFGSQLEMDSITGKYKFAPIEDEINVNKRRAAVGLEPLEEYAKLFDFEYSLPEK